MKFDLVLTAQGISQYDEKTNWDGRCHKMKCNINAVKIPMKPRAPLTDSQLKRDQGNDMIDGMNAIDIDLLQQTSPHRTSKHSHEKRHKPE